jgi:hypothetical protein
MGPTLYLESAEAQDLIGGVSWGALGWPCQWGQPLS